MIVLHTAAVLRGVQTSKQDDVPDQLKVRLSFTLLPPRIVLEQIVLPCLSLSHTTLKSFEHCLSQSLFLTEIWMPCIYEYKNDYTRKKDDRYFYISRA